MELMFELMFYLAGAVAVLATARVIAGVNAVSALLYLVVSLLAVALLFYLLGAPFAAALEVLIYAGAIMVLFVFVTMMLGLGPEAGARERAWLSGRSWAGPALLATLLLAELVYILTRRGEPAAGAASSPKDVGIALFGPYLLGVELASLLLLAALVGACHLGWRGSGRD